MGTPTPPGYVAEHTQSRTNPTLHLCQEYAMRTGGYDERARVQSRRHGWTTFHALVEELGVIEAILDVERCHWLSMSDWLAGHALDDVCRECLEVAHA